VNPDGPDVLWYRNLKRDQLSKGRIVAVVAVLMLTALVTTFVLLPIIVDSYTGQTAHRWFVFGGAGKVPIFEKHHEWHRGPPVVTSDTINFHWLNLLWNVLFLGGIWTGCIYLCRRIRRR
jgi:hypothetical protein